MITQQQLINKIRLIIAERDPQNSFVSDPDIIDIINESICDFSRDILLPKTNITFITDGNVEYKQSGDVISIISVFCKTILDYIDYEDYLSSLSNGFESINGNEPDIWYQREGLNDIENDNVLIVGLSPTPSSGLTITLNVVKSPPLLSSQVVSLPYPSTCLTALAYKLISQLMEADKKFEQSIYFFNRYEDEKTKLKLLIQNRVIDYINVTD